MSDCDYVAFLRGISNIPMQPFREALERLDLDDVRSFGGTGNLLFRAKDASLETLEALIAGAVGVETFVRSRPELGAVVAENPFAGRPDAGVFFVHDPIDPRRVASFLDGGFGGEPPVIAGTETYFIHPLRRPGRRGIIDLEHELGERGTMRASRVVARISELM